MDVHELKVGMILKTNTSPYIYSTLKCYSEYKKIIAMDDGWFYCLILIVKHFLDDEIKIEGKVESYERNTIMFAGHTVIQHNEISYRDKNKVIIDTENAKYRTEFYDFDWETFKFNKKRIITELKKKKVKLYQAIFRDSYAEHYILLSQYFSSEEEAKNQGKGASLKFIKLLPETEIEVEIDD